MLEPCAECGGRWGAHYSSCGVAAGQFVAELGQYGRATAEDDPRCPECGYSTTDWCEFAGRYTGDGDSFTVTCAHCEHEYVVEIVVRCAFRVEAGKSTPARGNETQTPDELP